MTTECSEQKYLFQELKSRKVEATFDGGDITSDGGGVLIRELSERLGILNRFAKCFEDFRNPDLIEHSVLELVKQRVYGIVLGYGDLNDHEELRRDFGFAAMVGKEDVTGAARKQQRDKGIPLASDSTLNRLELTRADADAKQRYKKIRCHAGLVEEFFVEEFIRAHRKPPKRIILDLDATDLPLHGDQEGRFFHGYYDCYCYLPLYIFCGDHPLCAKQRCSNIDASAGSIEQLECIVRLVREKWPDVRILIRADSGFAREEIMRWCEDNGIDYVLGLAKNERLKAMIVEALAEAQKISKETGKAARVFRDLQYCTLDSWSRTRRVVAKAEHLPEGTNPRCVVTSLSARSWRPKRLYENLYCARGDMENRIKEQLPLFADRMSTETLRANQIRLWFSTVAYLIFAAFRRIALKGTQLAKAQVETVRNKLLKIGALVRVSVRRVHYLFASGYPYKEIFTHAYQRIVQLQT